MKVNFMSFQEYKYKIGMIGNETDEFINELFELLFTRYQLGLEVSMKGSDFVL